jgi:hypothetical protein
LIDTHFDRSKMHQAVQSSEQCDPREWTFLIKKSFSGVIKKSQTRISRCKMN